MPAPPAAVAAAAAAAAAAASAAAAAAAAAGPTSVRSPSAPAPAPPQSPREGFDAEAFLRSPAAAGEGARAFLERVVPSLQFQMFVEARLRPAPGDADVAFFDESALRLLRRRSLAATLLGMGPGAAAAAAETPFLCNRAESVAKTVLALPPDAAGLPPGAGTSAGIFFGRKRRRRGR